MPRHRWNSKPSQPKLLVTKKAEWKYSRNGLPDINTYRPQQLGNLYLDLYFGQLVAVFSFKNKLYLFQIVIFSYDHMHIAFPSWAYIAITQAFPNSYQNSQSYHPKVTYVMRSKHWSFPRVHFTLERFKNNTNSHLSVILWGILMTYCAIS